jgi:hypothetical protein
MELLNDSTFGRKYLNVNASINFTKSTLPNIARLGRQWFGESFEVKEEQEFDFNFLIDTTSPVKLKLTALQQHLHPQV